MKKLNILITLYSILTVLVSMSFLLAYNQYQGKETSFVIIFLLWIFEVLLISALFLFHFHFFKKNTIPEKQKSSGRLNNSDSPDQSQVQYQKQINKDEVLSDLIRTASTKKSIIEFAEELLRKMADEFSIVQGVFYGLDKKENIYKSIASYAFMHEEKPKDFAAGDGLNGQTVVDKEIKIIHQIPEDYRIILSGLGESNPSHLYLIPLTDADKTVGLIEISTFKILSESRIMILEQLMSEAGNLLKKYLIDE